MLIFAGFQPLAKGIAIVRAVAFSRDPLIQRDLTDGDSVDLEQVLSRFGDEVRAFEVEDFLGR